jgi:ankyrin repeat protein
MSLLDLPNELLCQIVEDLPTEKDIFSIARASKRLYHLTIALLYRFNAEHSKSSALLWAATHGQLATAEKALKERLDAQKPKNISRHEYAQSTPSIEAALVLAAENNHEALVRLLIKNGASPNWGDRSRKQNAMEVASGRGHTQVVKTLLELGASARIGFGLKLFAIQLAALNGHIEIVRLLIDAGEDPDRNNGRPAGGAYSPLQAAILSDNQDLAKLLLAKGAKVNHRRANGDTPLEFAIMKRRLQLASLLLDAGAKVYRGQSRHVRHPALESAGRPGCEDFLELIKNETVHSWSEEDDDRF